MNNSPKGQLIVIDGTDGSGKKTQTDLLFKELSSHKIPVKMISFPQYGKPSAELIQQYLAGSLDVSSPYGAASLYAYDRFAAKKQICDWLAEGNIVIADRYTFSNSAHQGGKIEDFSERIKFFKWVETLEYQYYGLPKPDLTIILHVPAEISFELIKKRSAKTGVKQDIHELDMGHLKRAELVYLQLARMMPKTSVIHCANNNTLGTVQDIQNKIWQLIYKLILKNMIM